jgi:hypothetical protein
MDMGEEKELGLIAAWSFQELYVFVGDFLCSYLWLLIHYMCPCGLVWNDEHIYLIRYLGVISSWEDKVPYCQAKTQKVELS